MDFNTSKENDFLVDLESGGETSCEEEISNEPALDSRQAENMFTSLFSGVLGFNGSDKGECSVSLYSNLRKSSDIPRENVKLIIDRSSRGGQSGEQVPLAEQKIVKEKRKTTNPKKAHKPPRPPKGPSLDATDIKFVKEISELAIKKRARIERMKLLKKTKATKSSSSSNSAISAMVVTLLFCLVLIFQDTLYVMLTRLQLASPSGHFWCVETCPGSSQVVVL
ncbi:unnamed protein product [Ilex paraguariensis]|uniref:Uncharacterized protein n=1 Tax=Ilex paraguariensis TaxID=185542 RepID=A0ABC8RQD1_9AQUA